MDIDTLHDTITGYIADGEFRDNPLEGQWEISRIENQHSFVISRYSVRNSQVVQIGISVFKTAASTWIKQSVDYGDKELCWFEFGLDASGYRVHDHMAIVRGNAFEQEGEHEYVEDEYVVGGDVIKTLYFASLLGEGRSHRLRLLRTKCHVYMPVDPNAFTAWIAAQPGRS